MQKAAAAYTSVSQKICYFQKICFQTTSKSPKSLSYIPRHFKS
nr:MAG TPA: hypothetical protein [Caudoviricetes sp.]